MNENVRPTLPGIPMLLALIVASLLNVWFYLLAAKLGVLAVLLNVALSVALLLGFAGLFMVQPNTGAVLQLFGRYVGTAREAGLRWANPFFSKTPISLRVRNFESSKLKVNDTEGSPIEIAAVVVWQVHDTARPGSR